MTTSTILLVLMSLGVVAALLHPLLASRSRNRRVSRGPSEIDALLRRKANLYANMKDLEFEFQMGKLSPADYERLRDDDRAEAARLLHEIEALEDRDDVDAIIEREIAARRASRERGGAQGEAPEPSTRRASDAPSAIESAAAAMASTATSTSTSTSTATAAAAAPRPVAFCSACGARVRPADRFCSACGSAIRSGDDA
ncbi:MAG: zinc ribbon domain-containing protein [bacterium]